MSEEDVLLVRFSWDSGPFATYWTSEDKRAGIEGPNGYGTNTVPVPRAVWERYESAAEEMRAAEQALDQAEQSYLDAARREDPRWQAKV